MIRSNSRLLLAVVIGLAIAGTVTALTLKNHRAVTTVHLIPAATIYRAAPTGGGPTWGGSAWVPSPFRRAQLHHPWCGRRISPQIRGIHGIYRMWFAHCAMNFGPIKVYHWQPRPRRGAPTPLPEQSVVGGILGGTATPRPIHVPLSTIPAPPAPAVRPSPTRAVSTPVPDPTAIVFPIATPVLPRPTPLATVVPSAIAYELSLMNASRAQHGLPAYTENRTQSNGTGSCVGSIGHSRDMAASGTIWHVNPAYPSASFPNNLCLQYSSAGENVGEASGSVTQALDTIHGLMLQEPYTPGCSGNHVCSILSSVYRQVGIGIVTTNSGTYLAVDFLS